jgi:hypothetical protein
MSFLDWCEQHRIIVMVFPPHSTHRLQPLDVSLFYPLSIANTEQFIEWTAKTQGLISLSKREFGSNFLPAYTKAFSLENIQSGWERTGLLPFDPDIILSQISLPNEEERLNTASSVDYKALTNPSALELLLLIKSMIRPTKKLIQLPESSKIRLEVFKPK